ncbi:hypothetical protein NPIL_495921 [Nephila pilipes]|uniref:Uncharacterized protein n=1 Tax=Nephila pilipes TaxID=299642 RepID=A0A8X6MAX3_NEPPI|nr:hypothetical protein NPIL_495921 [Nephila pilipes]
MALARRKVNRIDGYGILFGHPRASLQERKVWDALVSSLFHTYLRGRSSFSRLNLCEICSPQLVLFKESGSSETFLPSQVLQNWE